MKSLFFALALFSSIAITRGEPMKVAVLTTILADIVQNVGGDRVQVIEVIKPGMDPHLYEPTPDDIKNILSARLVIASGLGFEGYLEKLKSSLGRRPTFVVAGDVLTPIFLEEGHGHDHQHSHAHDIHGKIADPHWWHSVRNVQAVAHEVKKALIAKDPEGKATYEANAKVFDTKLDNLSNWIRLEVAKLPRTKRILVTSHDALGYFAHDYGFKIHTIQGISTADQPSSRHVRALIEIIKEEDVKAIFAENIENPKVLEHITQETGTKLGGILYTDGLGKDDASTYEGMMRSNVTTIVRALR